ncbi:hypothetical protein GMRT_15644 [Giardia muris]|uniref:Uncharacterized protein n=1 Tax=Giardia muris TaxID=5742 RepID=A0A4Z1SUZ4_GIAMU|nr:hypothetical protein GMRT_15644 [Giardia muris]|eukprot:TNJ28765.1 hypothetical protein GMRT_15644 [Giardia muris]
MSEAKQVPNSATQVLPTKAVICGGELLLPERVVINWDDTNFDNYFYTDDDDDGVKPASKSPVSSPVRYRVAYNLGDISPQRWPASLSTKQAPAPPAPSVPPSLSQPPISQPPPPIQRVPDKPSLEKAPADDPVVDLNVYQKLAASTVSTVEETTRAAAAAVARAQRIRNILANTQTGALSRGGGRTPSPQPDGHGRLVIAQSGIKDGYSNNPPQRAGSIRRDPIEPRQASRTRGSVDPALIKVSQTDQKEASRSISIRGMHTSTNTRVASPDVSGRTYQHHPIPPAYPPSSMGWPGAEHSQTQAALLAGTGQYRQVSPARNGASPIQSRARASEYLQPPPSRSSISLSPSRYRANSTGLDSQAPSTYIPKMVLPVGGEHLKQTASPPRHPVSRTGGTRTLTQPIRPNDSPHLSELQYMQMARTNTVQEVATMRPHDVPYSEASERIRRITALMNYQRDRAGKSPRMLRGSQTSQADAPYLPHGY